MFSLSAVASICAPGSPAIARSVEALRHDPAAIDRAVADFTGAAIGDVGGARARADARLQLDACAGPLVTSWYGTRKAAVRVECLETHDGAGPWRIFIATRPPDTASTTPGLPTNQRASQKPASPVIKRGDPITVVVRGRGFSVQQAGEAVDSGHIGDWIGVRTSRQAQAVRARVERPGLAIIPLG